MQAIKDDKEIYIQFYSLTSAVESSVIKLLHRFLEHNDLLYLKDMLLTVLKELINNAIKANLKRLFFNEKDLDITKPECYNKGMETFKDETYTDKSLGVEKLIPAKLVVRVSFISRNGKLQLYVINNSPILDEELEKIKVRTKKASMYTDISEAFDDVLDDSEGAGLGLIMALMLFKNAGLPGDAFKAFRKGNLTVASITISGLESRDTRQIQLTEEILREIDSLPSFPMQIKEIQRLCSIPDSKIKDISEQIKKDPGLTANILKLANSAGYMSINRVETIEEAVMKIGLKGINTLLVASGVQKIMDSRYKKFETIWKNSYRTAFYAQRIAMQIRQGNIVEHVYLAALLSAIGKLVILSLKPEVAGHIRQLVGIKGMGDTGILEEISIGISHATLGSHMLKKWNFNEALIKTVEFHNRPHMAPEQYRDLIYIVYLANSIQEIDNNRGRFETLDENVLNRFNITDIDSFTMLHNVLKQAYEVQSRELR